MTSFLLYNIHTVYVLISVINSNNDSMSCFLVYTAIKTDLIMALFVSNSTFVRIQLQLKYYVGQFSRRILNAIQMLALANMVFKNMQHFKMIASAVQEELAYDEMLKSRRRVSLNTIHYLQYNTQYSLLFPQNNDIYAYPAPILNVSQKDVNVFNNRFALSLPQLSPDMPCLFIQSTSATPNIP